MELVAQSGALRAQTCKYAEDTVYPGSACRHDILHSVCQTHPSTNDGAVHLNALVDESLRLVCKLKEKWIRGVAVEQARNEEKLLEDFVTATRFLQTAH